MSKPHIPVEPASSPDDDPTGVRALLSALPEPDPMPAYLVERINASLTAEQSQRAASFSRERVTPLVAAGRRRPGPVLFAIAGAAAVVVVAVLGTGLFKINQTGGSAASLSAAVAPTHSGAGSTAPPSVDGKALPDAALAVPLIQIRESQTRYTSADFATQARRLGSAVFGGSQVKPTDRLSLEPLGSPSGLTDCLRAVGVVNPKMVRADLAFYEGVPAVIIVATTSHVPTAYAVGQECSPGNAALLHPATPLP